MTILTIRILPEIKNGTLMGANVDGTRGIEVFYKDADYSYFENYIKTLAITLKVHVHTQGTAKTLGIKWIFDCPFYRVHFK